MAISIISSEVRTSTGNITIPANCDFVVALVLGTTNPTINLVSMTQNCSNGVSISTMASPPTGTIGCTVGQATRFVYLSGAGAVRDAEAGTSGALPFAIDTVIGDYVFGIGLLGISELTGDAGAFTYLDNFFRGYKEALDTSMSCSGQTSEPAGTSFAFASVIEGGAVGTGDGTMISWIN